jgi:hypothetical protein
MPSVTHRGELAEETQQLINNLGRLPKELDSSGEIQRSITDTAAMALQAICSGTIAGESPDGGATAAGVDADWAAELAADAIKAMKAIEAGLAENGLTLEQAQEKTITININARGADKVRTVLAPGLIGRVAAQGIDRIVRSTLIRE